MLSEEERRRLEAIERDLETGDPKLAKRFVQPFARRIRWLAVALIACLAALVAAAVNGLWALAILAVVPVLMMAAGTFARYREAAKDADRQHQSPE